MNDRQGKIISDQSIDRTAPFGCIPSGHFKAITWMGRNKKTSKSLNLPIQI
jgi:hypothetical protein